MGFFCSLVTTHLCLSLPVGLFPSASSTNTLYASLLSPIPATCPTHFILLSLVTWIKFAEERPLSSSLHRLFHSPVTSSVLCPNVLLSTLFSNTLSQHSSLHVRDQVSQPYKTTYKIIVMCILIFIFLDSKQEDKKILQWMKASFPWHLSFFMNGILIC